MARRKRKIKTAIQSYPYHSRGGRAARKERKALRR